MKNLLHKFSIGLLFLYIASIYIFSYNEELYIISNVLFALLAGAAVLYVMMNGSMIVPKVMYSLFFFYMVMVASYFWIVKDMNVTHGNLTMVLMIGIVGIIINIIVTEKDIGILLRFIYFAGIAMCLYSLAVYGFEETIAALGDDSIIRLGKEINQENVFGIICAVTAVIGLYFAYYEKKGIYYLITLIPIIYAFTSGSRKVILILIVSLIILIIAKKGRSRTTTFLITALSVVIILILINYVKSLNLYIFKRFESFLDIFGDDNTKADGSTMLRMQMIKEGIRWFLQRPILGYGIDQYSVMFYLENGRRMYSHSNVIEVLVNFGIVGFVAYYTIYYYMLVKIIRALKRKIPYAVIMLLIFGVLMVTNLFSVVLYSKNTYILVGTVLAYININKDKLNKIPEETVEDDSEGEV